MHVQMSVGGPSGSMLRHDSRRSVITLVAVMILTALVTIGGTRYVVGTFRDSALRVDREATATEALKQEIVAHAVLVASPAASTPRLEISMLESAIRDAFSTAIAAQGSSDAASLLRASHIEWESLVTALRSSGGLDVASRPAVISEHLPTVLSLLDDAAASGRADVRTSLAAAQRWERVAIVVIAVLELLGVGMVVRLARRNSARVLKPLGDLRDSANRLAAGDLDHRLAIDRADELGELAASFNVMADSIAADRRALTRQASTDSLCGLANRSAFGARLEASLVQPDRRTGAQAVLFVDLDDFKEVNDRLGHEAGDELLREVARRLSAMMRPGDLVARLGGDEFALLLVDLAHPRIAADVADRVVAALAEPVVLGSDSVQIGASVGVVLRDDECTADQLMRRADIAMYAAKSRGKNRVEVFDSCLDEASMTRLLLRADVRLAVERRELSLELDPVIDLGTGAVVGVEARPRWTHPTKGLLANEVFLDVADETGAIVAVGSWALDTAARLMATWRVRYHRPDLWLSVNISKRELDAAGFVPRLLDTAESAGLPPGNLVLEIDESLFARTSTICRADFDRLRERGVRIALDRFGNGYSSVGWLRQLPLDVIKIDRSFTADARPGSDGDDLLGAIVALARRLDLEVVPEGVDDPAQLERLQAMGCRIAQGDLLCPPAGADQVERLLAGSDRALWRPLRDHWPSTA